MAATLAPAMPARSKGPGPIAMPPRYNSSLSITSVLLRFSPPPPTLTFRSSDVSGPCTPAPHTPLPYEFVLSPPFLAAPC